ncbi:hypothetical protein Skr01_41830 [Sphaerisporangium krabiense]|nr:hypothetical protein Skr01_41830 [Sphaerisporangium krabiense]
MTSDAGSDAALLGHPVHHLLGGGGRTQKVTSVPPAVIVEGYDRAPRDYSVNRYESTIFGAALNFAHWREEFACVSPAIGYAAEYEPSGESV